MYHLCDFWWSLSSRPVYGSLPTLSSWPLPWCAQTERDRDCWYHFLFLEGHQSYCIRAHLMTSFNLNYLLKGPISKCHQSRVWMYPYHTYFGAWILCVHSSIRNSRIRALTLACTVTFIMWETELGLNLSPDLKLAAGWLQVTCPSPRTEQGFGHRIF